MSAGRKVNTKSPIGVHRKNILKRQVIVCENTKANWLYFKPLIEITGQRVKTTEAIITWT